MSDLYSSGTNIKFSKGMRNCLEMYNKLIVSSIGQEGNLGSNLASANNKSFNIQCIIMDLQCNYAATNHAECHGV